MKSKYIQLYSNLIWVLGSESSLRAAAILRSALKVIPGISYSDGSLFFGNYRVDLSTLPECHDYDWWEAELTEHQSEVFPPEAEWLDESYVQWELSNLGYAERTAKVSLQRCLDLVLAAFDD